MSTGQRVNESTGFDYFNYYLNYSKIRRRVNDSFISLQETLTRLYIVNCQLSIVNC